MNKALIDGFPSTVSDALDDVDKHVFSHHGDQSTYSAGPFGVFEAVECVLHENEMSHAEVPLCSFEEHNTVDDFLESSLDFMQWDDLFQWDVDDFGINSDQTVSLHPSVAFHDQPSNGAKQAAHVEDVSDPYWPALDLVIEAPLLLRHFNDQVITQMGSLPINEKSAWRILNFPSAVFTLSQLTTLAVDRDNIRHANLANFFAIIAVSALHLSVSPVDTPGFAGKDQDWTLLSNRTYLAAKHHLNLSLGYECTPPGKAKYKDQLMAVGAILATAVCCRPQPARSFANLID